MSLNRVAGQYRRWPKWGRIAAPVAAALVVLSGLGSCATEKAAGDDGQIAEEVEVTSTTTAVDLDELARLAIVASEIEMPASRMRALITSTCDLEDEKVDGLGAVLTRHAADEAQMRRLVEALGEAAKVSCPDLAKDTPGLLSTLYVSARGQITTTTTAAPTTTTTAAPPTTAAPVTTAAPPPPPPRPTTTSPPPPPPPPPASTYYANCSAARAAGAAPVYRGDPGYGSHLDRDDDGVGCES